MPSLSYPFKPEHFIYLFDQDIAFLEVNVYEPDVIHENLTSLVAAYTGSNNLVCELGNRGLTCFENQKVTNKQELIKILKDIIKALN